MPTGNVKAGKVKGGIIGSRFEADIPAASFQILPDEAEDADLYMRPVFDELYNWGFPQEMRHFARCVRGKEQPLANGEDGRVVQEVLFAAHASAALGRKVALPFRPRGPARPFEFWRDPALAARTIDGNEVVDERGCQAWTAAT